MTNETTQDAVESTELVNDIQHVATPAKKTAPKKVAKKTAKKAPAKAAKKSETKGKKTPAKKATKAAPAAKAEKNGRSSNGIGKPRTAILETLSKYPEGLTRTQIAEKTGINSGFTSLLGHVEADKREDKSLAKEGYIKIQVQDIDGKNVTIYVITAKGRKIVGK